LHLSVVKPAVAQHLLKLIAGALGYLHLIARLRLRLAYLRATNLAGGPHWEKYVQQALFSLFLRFGTEGLVLLFPHHSDADFHEVPDHGFDVTPNVTD